MKVNQNTMTGSFLCNKGIRQGTAILSPVLLIFSSLIFMNDLPEYFRAHNCPSVMLGNQSLKLPDVNGDDLLVISNSPEDCNNRWL